MTYCFSVFVFLTILHAVKGETCYSISQGEKVENGTLHATCHDPVCCADQVRSEGYFYSQITGNTCYVYDTSTAIVKTGANRFFVREDNCAYQDPMCLLPNTTITSYTPAFYCSREDCHTLCRWAINCNSARYQLSTNACNWYNPTRIANAFPFNGRDLYIRCGLTTTSTTTQIPTLTITTTTTSTTKPALTTPVTTTTTTTTKTSATVMMPLTCETGFNGRSRLFGFFALGKFADDGIDGAPTYHVTVMGLCAIQCSNNPDCGMYSFNQAVGLCNIFNRMASSLTMTSLDGWMSYKEMCN